MARALFSPAARNDLLEIWAYIAADDFRAADRYVAKLLAAANVVATLPGLGRERRELSGAPRSFAIDSHVLFYELARGGIRVLRVLHGRRDIPPLFDSEF